MNLSRKWEVQDIGIVVLRKANGLRNITYIMAEDTRESIPPVAEVTQTNNTQEPPQRKPKYEAPKSQVGKLWDAFGNPEDQANVLPGAVSNSKKEDATITEAMKSLSAKDLTTFYKMPCARDALMLGIGAAFGVGGIRAILGGIIILAYLLATGCNMRLMIFCLGMRSLWTASNWAVGTFAITSLGSHEFCQRRRVQELDGMKQAVELMHQLKVKKQREKEQKLEEAARLAEEEKRRKSWTNPSNYKFW